MSASLISEFRFPTGLFRKQLSEIRAVVAVLEVPIEFTAETFTVLAPFCPGLVSPVPVSEESMNRSDCENLVPFLDQVIRHCRSLIEQLGDESKKRNRKLTARMDQIRFDLIDFIRANGNSEFEPYPKKMVPLCEESINESSAVGNSSPISDTVVS